VAERVRVTFGNGASVVAEVVRTDPERERGLSWRHEVQEGTGMLFDMGFTGDHVMWMRDTFVSLDMLFLNVQGRVEGLVEEAVPQSFERRSGNALSRYVLEVPGGWARRHGVWLSATATFSAA